MILNLRTADDTEKLQYLVAISGLEFLEAVQEFYSKMDELDTPSDITHQIAPKQAREILKECIDKHVLVKLEKL